MHYTEALTEFIEDLKQTVGEHNWIDAPEQLSDGLGHVAPVHIHKSAFIVEIGVPVAYADSDEISQVKTDVENLADEYGVAVEQVQANQDSITFRYSLQAMFMDAPA